MVEVEIPYGEKAMERMDATIVMDGDKDKAAIFLPIVLLFVNLQWDKINLVVVPVRCWLCEKAWLTSSVVSALEKDEASVIWSIVSGKSL